MSTTIHGRLLELTLGDITVQDVDAIVNAANSRLAGGGGVDGAIHRAGGATIMADTQRRYPDGCATGSAVISMAGDLQVKYVIHAVGPVWRGGNAGEDRLLGSAYHTALELADKHGCRSIALPALSTGAYRYPLEAAAEVAIAVSAGFLKGLSADSPLRLVRFVLFSSEALAAFESAVERLQLGD